jgi:hypothetical protein
LPVPRKDGDSANICFIAGTDFRKRGVVQARVKFHSIFPFDCPLPFWLWFRDHFRAVKNCMLVPQKWRSWLQVFVAVVK